MEFNGTFFVSIISFVLFVFIMNKILYAPILNIMAERKNLIDLNYQAAEKNNAEVQNLNNQIETKLADTKDDAREEYINAIDEYKSQQTGIIRDTQDFVKNELENSKVELSNLSDEVKNGLKGSMNDLANDIVEKVIGYRANIDNFDDEKVNSVLWGDK